MSRRGGPKPAPPKDVPPPGRRTQHKKGGKPTFSGDRANAYLGSFVGYSSRPGVQTESGGSESSFFQRFVAMDSAQFFKNPIADGNMDYDSLDGSETMASAHAVWLNQRPVSPQRSQPLTQPLKVVVQEKVKLLDDVFYQMLAAMAKAQTTQTGVNVRGSHDRDGHSRIEKLCQEILDCNSVEDLQAKILKASTADQSRKALDLKNDFKSTYESISDVLIGAGVEISKIKGKGGVQLPPAIDTFFANSAFLILRYAAEKIKNVKSKNDAFFRRLKGESLPRGRKKIFQDDISRRLADLTESLEFATDVACNQAVDVKKNNIHVAVKQPALEGFQSEVVPDLKLPNDGKNLSRDQLQAIRDIEHAFSASGKAMMGKAEIRLPTGAGKSWLSNIIKTYYQGHGGFKELKRLDLYSSEQEMRGLQDLQGDGKSFVSIDESFFFSRNFIDSFWNRADGDFDATNTEHLIRIESARTDLIRRLRSRGVIVLSWGASEELSKLRIEILREGDKIKNLRNDIELVRAEAQSRRDQLGGAELLSDIRNLIISIDSFGGIPKTRPGGKNYASNIFSGKPNDNQTILDDLVKHARSLSGKLPEGHALKAVLSEIAAVSGNYASMADAISVLLTNNPVERELGDLKAAMKAGLSVEQESRLQMMQAEIERRTKKLQAKESLRNSLEGRHDVIYEKLQDSDIAVLGEDVDKRLGVLGSVTSDNIAANGVTQFITDQDLTAIASNDKALQELVAKLGVHSLVITVKASVDGDHQRRSTMPVVKYVTAAGVASIHPKTSSEVDIKRFYDNIKRNAAGGKTLCVFDKYNHVGGDYGVLSRDVKKQIVALEPNASINSYMQALGRNRDDEYCDDIRLLSRDREVTSSHKLVKKVKQASKTEDAVRTYSYLYAKAKPRPEVAQDPSVVDYSGLLENVDDNGLTNADHRVMQIEDPESISRALTDALNLWQHRIDGHRGYPEGYPSTATGSETKFLNMNRASMQMPHEAVESPFTPAHQRRPGYGGPPLPFDPDESSPPTTPGRKPTAQDELGLHTLRRRRELPNDPGGRKLPTTPGRTSDRPMSPSAKHAAAEILELSKESRRKLEAVKAFPGEFAAYGQGNGYADFTEDQQGQVDSYFGTLELYSDQSYQIENFVKLLKAAKEDSATSLDTPFASPAPASHGKDPARDLIAVIGRLEIDPEFFPSLREEFDDSVNGSENSEEHKRLYQEILMNKNGRVEIKEAGDPRRGMGGFKRALTEFAQQKLQEILPGLDFESTEDLNTLFNNAVTKFHDRARGVFDQAKGKVDEIAKQRAREEQERLAAEAEEERQRRLAEEARRKTQEEADLKEQADAEALHQAQKYLLDSIAAYVTDNLDVKLGVNGQREPNPEGLYGIRHMLDILRTRMSFPEDVLDTQLLLTIAKDEDHPLRDYIGNMDMSSIDDLTVKLGDLTQEAAEQRRLRVAKIQEINDAITGATVPNGTDLTTDKPCNKTSMTGILRGIKYQDKSSIFSAITQGNDLLNGGTNINLNDRARRVLMKMSAENLNAVLDRVNAGIDAAREKLQAARRKAQADAEAALLREQQEKAEADAEALRLAKEAEENAAKAELQRFVTLFDQVLGLRETAQYPQGVTADKITEELQKEEDGTFAKLIGGDEEGGYKAQLLRYVNAPGSALVYDPGSDIQTAILNSNNSGQLLAANEALTTSLQALEAQVTQNEADLRAAEVERLRAEKEKADAEALRQEEALRRAQDELIAGFDAYVANNLNVKLGANGQQVPNTDGIYNPAEILGKLRSVFPERVEFKSFEINPDTNSYGIPQSVIIYISNLDTPAIGNLRGQLDNLNRQADVDRERLAKQKAEEELRLKEQADADALRRQAEEEAALLLAQQEEADRLAKAAKIQEINDAITGATVPNGTDLTTDRPCNKTSMTGILRGIKYQDKSSIFSAITQGNDLLNGGTNINLNDRARRVLMKMSAENLNAVLDRVNAGIDAAREKLQAARRKAQADAEAALLREQQEKAEADAEARRQAREKAKADADADAARRAADEAAAEKEAIIAKINLAITNSTVPDGDTPYADKPCSKTSMTAILWSIEYSSGSSIFADIDKESLLLQSGDGINLNDPARGVLMKMSAENLNAVLIRVNGAIDAARDKLQAARLAEVALLRAEKAQADAEALRRAAEDEARRRPPINSDLTPPNADELELRPSSSGLGPLIEDIAKIMFKKTREDMILPDNPVYNDDNRGTLLRGTNDEMYDGQRRTIVKNLLALANANDAQYNVLMSNPSYRKTVEIFDEIQQKGPDHAFAKIIAGENKRDFVRDLTEEMNYLNENLAGIVARKYHDKSLPNSFDLSSYATRMSSQDDLTEGQLSGAENQHYIPESKVKYPTMDQDFLEKLRTAVGSKSR